MGAAEDLAQKLLTVDPAWVVGVERDLASASPDFPDVRLHAGRIGSLIWSATGPEDLADRLADAVEDPHLPRIALEIAGVLFRGSLRELPGFQSLAQGIVRASEPPLVAGLVQDLLEGLRLHFLLSRLFAKGRGGEIAESRSATEIEGEDGIDLTSVPRGMLRAVLAGYKAAICVSALVDLALSGRHPPPWLIQLVAHTWVESERKFLPLIAMDVEDKEIPDDVLPVSERLSGAEIIRKHNEGEAAFQQFIQRARTSRTSSG